MLSVGTLYRCQSCGTEVEIINSQAGGGPLVCCEVEMNRLSDEFERMYEKEAYDASDWDWN